MKSAVHFGAGNIGRGFIGLLLHQAGYHVTFIDVNAVAVDAINSRGEYVVSLAAPQPQPVVVTEISAVDAADSGAVTAIVANADMITTAVGANVLPSIAPALARGLQARAAGRPPVTVIACENLIGASTSLGRLVYESTPAGIVISAVFADCTADRIVPLQTPTKADPLGIIVEPFYEWIIDGSALSAAQTCDLSAAMFVQDLSPYLERKLYTVNTGHAAAAYLGYRAGCRHIHEALVRPEIFAAVQAAVHEAGAGLIARHGFDVTEHRHYIEQMMGRFSNSLLLDDVTRVARCPLRKLGTDERLVAPARYAIAAGTVPDQLARVIAAALHFDFAGDHEAVELQAALRANGATAVLTRYTSLAPDDPLLSLIMEHYEES